jgi:hypothetical protein
MITVLIIAGILIVFVVGFNDVYKRHSRIVEKIDFAGEYRDKFVELANKYFQNYDRYNRSGTLDNELYVWLTLNVNKMQGNLGGAGVMDYSAPFQMYRVHNYQIVINTIPKFRDGSVENFDINSVDDCLLRYIGQLEEYGKDTLRNLKNPIIWFREGFREVLSIPIFILNWFGIISSRTVYSIKDSLIYKAISGLIALVTLVSGVVTIVVGYDQTIEFAKKLLGK